MSTPYKMRADAQRLDLGKREGKKEFWRLHLMHMDLEYRYRYRELAEAFRTGEANESGAKMPLGDANTQAALVLADEWEYDLGEAQEYYPPEPVEEGVDG